MAISTISPINLFSGTDITTTTYTYNTGGWLKRRGDNTTLQLEVATLNATSITFRLEGRATTGDRSASIYSETFTGKTNIAKLIDKSDFPMSEYRLGAKVTTASSVAPSPNNVYASLISTEHVY